MSNIDQIEVGGTLYNIAGSGGGIVPHLVIISDTGSTVTVTKGLTIINATETSSGYFECDVPEFGTWIIDAVLNGDDAQLSLVVDTVKIYTIDDRHFHADINVIFPEGSQVSASKTGATTLYATSSPYTFTVHEEGVWTISRTLNGNTISTTVSITTSGQIEDIDFPTICGISRSRSTSSSAWTRTDDSVNFNFSASIGTTAGESDFDDILPWSGMQRENINNDVFVKIPKFYFRRYIESGVDCIKISDKQWEDFTIHPAFYRGGTEYDYIYVGAYPTSAGYVSQKGQAPLVSITRATARSGSHGRGSGYYQWDEATRSALQMIMLVEVADWNVQAKVGDGYTASSNTGAIVSGTCDNVPNLTGRPEGTSNKVGVVYRGVENLWGNVWQWCDGLNWYNDTYYVTNDPTKFADDTTSGYTALSYKGGTNWSAGYITQVGVDNNNPSYILPQFAGSGGSDTTYITDAVWSNTGWRVLRVGGRWTSGGLCGVGCVGLDVASSYAGTDFGSRLLKLPT